MTSVLIVVDHASNHVPADIDLGVTDDVMATHIGWDIGAAALADALGHSSHKAYVSRLVIDLNREEDSPGLIPIESDGIIIPGNVGAARSERIARFYRPYHDALATRIAAEKPGLLVSLHSFTPRLAHRPDEQRPWEVGVLYNNDRRAAGVALADLARAGICAGDQLPYSGRALNATMNRHGESTGTAYLGLEIRQDLIDTPEGIATWAARLRPIIDRCLDVVSSGVTKAP